MSHFTRSDLMLDRRTAAKTIASLAIGAPLIESVERWLAPDEEPRVSRPQGNVSLDEVERIENAAQVFRAWDDQFGGGLRRKAVVGQLSEVADILRDQHPPAVARRLFRAMSHLAETAAMMSWDSGHDAKAQRYYVLALRASKEAGDYAFGANILASLARQVLYLGHPDDALELVRLAQDGSRNQATPRVKAMLHTREAWAYANLGRVQAFRRATGKAEEELVRSPEAEDPHWIRYFDEAELAGVTGGRLLDLAEGDRRHAGEARDHIRRALQLRNPSSMRSLALDQAGLAQVHLISRDLDEATRVGHEAVDVAERINSDRVNVQLRELYTRTVPLSKTSYPVRELRDRLRDHLAS